MNDETIREVALTLDNLLTLKTDPENYFWDPAFCTGETTDIIALAESFIRMRRGETS